MLLFQDRTDAGRQLAQKLNEYVGREDVVLLPTNQETRELLR